MIKFYKLLFLIPIFIIGCKSNSLINKDFSQVIYNFDMNIFSTEGEKLFSIKSPSSSYENKSNIFKLNETTIHILKNNWMPSDISFKLGLVVVTKGEV